MVMNKKFSLSKPILIALAILVVLAVYCFAFMVPGQTELTAKRAELSVANAESALYRQYLTDLSPLESDIEAIQAEIDKLHAEGYINDSNVSFEISDAIQRYRVSVSSVSLETVTTFEGHRALPINIAMTGELENILKFIEHFENDEEGSYLVRGTTLEIAGNRVTTTMVIYLCTPDL